MSDSKPSPKKSWALEPIFKKISSEILFSFNQLKATCLGQFNDYYSNGYFDASLTPGLYLEKLTDYGTRNKILNHIWSFYMHDCGVNVIYRLGFGTGDLKRVDFQSQSIK